MEIPGAQDFWRHGLPHPLLGQTLDRCIVQYHCGVHDSAQWPYAALNGRDDLLRLLAIGDVRRANHHLDALLTQGLHRSLRRRRRAAAADQSQVTRAASCEAVGNANPESSEAPGDQIAGVGIDLGGP